jgi:hypothetical protein
MRGVSRAHVEVWRCRILSIVRGVVLSCLRDTSIACAGIGVSVSRVGIGVSVSRVLVSGYRYRVLVSGYREHACMCAACMRVLIRGCRGVEGSRWGGPCEILIRGCRGVEGSMPCAANVASSILHTVSQRAN